ncbi:N-acetylglucosamine-6-phosphate deacetylase [Sulfurovum sp.]|jgi:N-acetylglucosamine-6-phosphate deacetylase|uniref:N-acetylglucosamine-6-phosphate deacetylase n=1 Tax=Sulfurovum sp. TaxID=1969726 RepID=UPI002A37147A|nr:N-acetylglucosamine-6-phosphate deacetylase [Sulfurovum sp.]MDY0403716.1 N-acetylglucosamine-6-phosphate deacetylase [Sulfurovum sp.]
MMRAIINARLIGSDSVVGGKVLLFDKKIIGIADEVPEGAEVIDAKGAYASAGFIDLHIHGAGGADVMDATPQALETISDTLLQTGTTSFLATTMTMSTQAIDTALQNVKMHKEKVNGAQILGVHLEGPFINPSRHGAQEIAYIQRPNLDLIADHMESIRMITLAPEVEGVEAFIRHLGEQYPHIILSVGHSDASYDQCKASFGWGVSHATHLFNAMNGYHHREPGVIGAVLESDVTCDIIPDLVHTHPSTLELTYRLKKDKLILITDAMRAGCMKSGIYELGGQRVVVKEGRAELEDGTLAGSVLRLNEGLQKMVAHTSMTLVEAVNSVTKIPARKLGIPKGELREGYDADIVIFDEDFSIISTLVAGELKYIR